MKILVMNGPNINFLGIREKGIYGEQNYEALVSMIEKKAEELGVDVEVFQSNHEGAIIDKIQEAYYNDVDGIVINPGAFTHYSYTVRDALASVAAIPKIEVHRKVAKALEGFEGFHFHQLRHTYTSNLLANGAAPKDVQELLGHSDVSTTMNVYAHSTRDAKRKSVRLLDKVVGND